VSVVVAVSVSIFVIVLVVVLSDVIVRVLVARLVIVSVGAVLLKRSAMHFFPELAPSIHVKEAYAVAVLISSVTALGSRKVVQNADASHE
jgi:hypothetical protein